MSLKANGSGGGAGVASVAVSPSFDGAGGTEGGLGEGEQDPAGRRGRPGDRRGRSRTSTALSGFGSAGTSRNVRSAPDDAAHSPRWASRPGRSAFAPRTPATTFIPRNGCFGAVSAGSRPPPATGQGQGYDDEDTDSMSHHPSDLSARDVFVGSAMRTVSGRGPRRKMVRMADPTKTTTPFVRPYPMRARRRRSNAGKLGGAGRRRAGDPPRQVRHPGCFRA